MKKVLEVVLLCMLALALAGCSGKAKEDNELQPPWESGIILKDLGEIGENIQKIIDAKKLVVFTDPNFPPFEFLGSDGKPTGVDMEIAKVIANELGVELEIKEADFDSILMAINTGAGDIAITGMTITEDRKEGVDFSVPYINSVQYFILLENSDIKLMEDLAGKKVGVAMGYTGQWLMEDEIAGGVLTGAGVTIVECTSALEAALDMKNGRIDAVVMDEYVAKTIAANNSGLKAVEIRYKNGDIASEEYGVVVPKGKEDLLDLINKIVNRLVEMDKIAKWVAYFGE